MIPQVEQVTLSPCKVPAHKQQPLSRICIDKKCSQRAFICFTCEQDYHANHRTVAIREFLQEIDQSKYDPALQNKATELQKKIKQHKVDCLQLIAKARENWAQKLDKLTGEMGERIDYLDESVIIAIKQTAGLNISPIEISQQIKSSNPQITLKAIENFIQYRENIKPTLLKQMDQTAKNLGTCQSSVAAAFEELSRNLDTHLRRVLSIVQENRFEATVTKNFAEPPLIGNPLNWSVTLKHADIQLSNNRATRQVVSESSISVAVLAEDKLGTSKAWAVKITDKVGFIGVGICLEESLKKIAFKKVGWTNVGHGNYVVWEDGQVHSHSNSTVNGKRNAFSFTTGDILYLDYSSTEDKLIITKNRQVNRRWQFQIDKPPENDCYRACVYFYKQGDTVELNALKNSQ